MSTIRILATAALCSALPILTTQPSARGRAAEPLGAAQEHPVNPAARTMAAFTERVDAYLRLQKAEKAKLPTLKEEATPFEIDRHQRALSAAMAAVRAGAKQGDIFTPDMQRVARELMANLFKETRTRRDLRDSVMDENPTTARFKVNDRYPDAVPLSTMPPDVLKNLPRLPEALEYRFVGDTLILLDPDAHIVVDYVSRVLPK
jgi:hypothetical protein